MLINKSLFQYPGKQTITFNGQLIDFKSPVVMGILNVTPDSFFDGGQYQNASEILKRAETIINEGGSIIDIGAYSTRPGADDISAEEEIKRLLPAVLAVKSKFPDAVISIDTFRAEVAEKIITEAGDCIINDISGGTMDNRMFETVARLGVPYILMHIQGTPQNMQHNPEYKDIVLDELKYFSKRIDQLHLLGVKDVIIDPGFGFGKTLEHNYQLLNHFEDLKLLGLPILAGVSRKSMIFKVLGTTPAESLNGTSVLNTMALIGGANILRVHDVKEAYEAVQIFEKLKSVNL